MLGEGAAEDGAGEVLRLEEVFEDEGAAGAKEEARVDGVAVALPEAGVACEGGEDVHPAFALLAAYQWLYASRIIIFFQEEEGGGIPLLCEGAGDVAEEAAVVGEEEELGDGGFFGGREFLLVGHWICVEEAGGDEFSGEGGGCCGGFLVHEGCGVVDDENFLFFCSAPFRAEGEAGKVEVAKELFLAVAEAGGGAAVRAEKAVGVLVAVFEVKSAEACFGEEAVHFFHGGAGVCKVVALFRNRRFHFKKGALDVLTAGFDLSFLLFDGACFILSSLQCGGEADVHGVSDGGLAVVLPGDAVVDGFIVRLDLLIPAGEKVGEVA